MAYLAPRGRFWSAGSSSNGGHCDHDHHRDLRPSDGGRSSESWTTRSGDRSHSFTWGVIGRLRGHVEELHDRGPIEPRSRRDRAAIVEHLLRNQLHECQTWFSQGCAVRSTPNRRMIRPRSWSIVADPGEKRGSEETEFMAKLRPIRDQSRNGDVAPRNRSHYLANAPRSPSIGHDLRANFFFKNPCISSLVHQLLIDLWRN